MFSACLAASIQTMSSRLVPSWQWSRPTNHMGCGMSYISALMPCMHLPASLWGLRAKTHGSSHSCATVVAVTVCTCSCSHTCQSTVPWSATSLASASSGRKQQTTCLQATNKRTSNLNVHTHDACHAGFGSKKLLHAHEQTDLELTTNKVKDWRIVIMKVV